jgi:hypothetical protein
MNGFNDLVLPAFVWKDKTFNPLSSLIKLRFAAYLTFESKGLKKTKFSTFTVGPKKTFVFHIL